MLHVSRRHGSGSLVDSGTFEGGTQHDDECGVLLMDETGAVGLDLSFVAWVFLMEPIQDRSLETQVVARAHRMGARQAVHVETLVMQVGAACACMVAAQHRHASAPATGALQGVPRLGMQSCCLCRWVLRLQHVETVFFLGFATGHAN